MKTFHICYLIDKELCTGINIAADTYINAISHFLKHKGDDKNIIYVTELK